MQIKASLYRHIDRHNKPSPGKVRARVGLVGSDDGGLPSGESVLVCPAWAKTCYLKGDNRK